MTKLWQDILEHSFLCILVLQMPLIMFIWVKQVRSMLSLAILHFVPLNIAETVAQTCLITRDEQDEFALQSQLKCAHAMSLGHFDAEIEPIVISTSKSMSKTISFRGD